MTIGWRNDEIDKSSLVFQRPSVVVEGKKQWGFEYKSMCQERQFRESSIDRSMMMILLRLQLELKEEELFQNKFGKRFLFEPIIARQNRVSSVAGLVGIVLICVVHLRTLCTGSYVKS